MTFRPFRQAAALLLCSLIVFTQAPPAQSLSQNSAASPPSEQVLPDAKRAQRAVERGAKEEAQGHIDEALIAYDEAARYAPHDLAIVGRGAALRSRLIRDHVDNAERLALDGKMSAAKEELNTAMRIDPANQIVAERLSEMESMQDDELPPPPAAIPGMPRVTPRSGKQNFNIHGDTRSAYEQVAAAYGIKAVLDPDVVARSVHFQLEAVDFITAMSVLGSETSTFWRPLDATTIFVAPDTLEKRRLYGLQAEQTFPLPGPRNCRD